MITKASGLHSVRTSRWLFGALVALAGWCATDPSLAARARKGSASEAVTESAAIESTADAPSNQRTVSLTFKQLGAWSAVKLRGVDGVRSLFFTIRDDEVVVAAKLRLAYDYSPSLIPELSHLNVSLNGRIARVEGLPQGNNTGNVREITLNPRLFRGSNELHFNFIGHYTRQCEDPWHSSLWLIIGDLSRLELTLAPSAAAGDLMNLPAPFLDRRDTAALNLPFVFAAAPALGTIRAAGVVASWFGLQAGGRPIQFPTMLGQLPAGNAVVFLSGTDSVGGLRAASGAAVSIQPHPSNPTAKLLVVSGAGEEDIARAARAIALAHPGLVGASMNVIQDVVAPPRRPGDAPAWVRTDRPMKLGELARPEELQVQGYFPEVARVNFRVPPDLFIWRSEGVPLRLRYRATNLNTQRSSTLNIGVNSKFIHSLALNASAQKPGDPPPADRPNLSVRTASLLIPPGVVVGRNQLQMTYGFELLRDGQCQNIPPDNMVGAVDAESTIDFSGFPHYAALPNLAYFASMGYPFTRLADLSETSVVLPERASADELALYLALMGRMGESTGYPAVRHGVTNAAGVEKQPDRDLIVIGSGNNQALMTKWANRLPMVVENGERRVREEAYGLRPAYQYGWEVLDIAADAPSKIAAGVTLTGGGKLAALMAFESPLKAARSVVFLFADRSEDLRKLSDALLDSDRVGTIRGDFAVIDDKSVNHTRVGDTYYVGSLPVTNKLRWLLTDQPWLNAFFALLAVLAILALVALLYRPLARAMAHRRDTKK